MTAPTFTAEQLRLLHDLCVDAEQACMRKAAVAKERQDPRSAAEQLGLQERYADIREQIGAILIQGTTTTQDMLRDIRLLRKSIGNDE